MKRLYKIIILTSIAVIFLTGCSRTEFQTLNQKPILKDNTSIVLFGVKGHKLVDYLQFMGETKRLPAYNYRDLILSENIVALKVPTPEEAFHFGVYSSGKAGYVMDISYGYVTAKSKKITIDKIGVYYYGILDTDNNTIDQTINQDFLNLAKQKYKDLLKDLQPINFSW